MSIDLSEVSNVGSKEQGRGVPSAGTRGVSYPFMSLPEAVEAARKIYVKERRAKVPVAVAISHLGYSDTSSGGRQTISALLQFGLLEDEGRKEDRQVKLTDRALDALLAAEDSAERKAALLECVQHPKIFADIFSKWSEELPSDQLISFYLLRDRNFNPKAIHSFVKDLRTSLAYAGVEHPYASSSSAVKQPADTHDDVPHGHQTSQSPSGVALPPVVTPTATAGPITQSVLMSAPGETEWMKGNLSKTTSFRILLSGEISAKQVNKLIRLLEVQRDVLEDDDDVSDLA